LLLLVYGGDFDRPVSVCKGETNFDDTREAPLSEFMHMIHNGIELAARARRLLKGLIPRGRQGHFGLRGFRLRRT
jgi:hypothetical protein